MRLQPNRNYVSNDDVQTPLALARRVVAHFRPRGRILEPCAGDGNFLRALRQHARKPSPGSRSCALGSPHGTRVAWAEIKRGRDFFAWREKVDWIITNPPWSQFRAFLQHAMTCADRVAFLVTINHLWTRARIQDMKTAGFGIEEIVLLDTPAAFPPLGFQLGAVLVTRGWTGPITLADLTSSLSSASPRVASPRPVRNSLPRPRPLRSLPSQCLTGTELAALSSAEHVRLILQAA